MSMFGHRKKNDEPQEYISSLDYHKLQGKRKKKMFLIW